VADFKSESVAEISSESLAEFKSESVADFTRNQQDTEGVTNIFQITLQSPDGKVVKVNTTDQQFRLYKVGDVIGK
jgi:hypothetical protein